MFYALINKDDEPLYKTGFNRVLDSGDNDIIGLCKNVNDIADLYDACIDFIRVVIVPHDVNIQKDEYMQLDKVVLGEKYPLYDVKTIKKFNLIINETYIINVCSNGHLEILKYLHIMNDDLINNLICNSEVFDWISSGDNVKILEWWKSSGMPLNYTECSLIMASCRGSCGYINVLDWWLNSKLPLKYDERAIDFASSGGHINVLNWWLNSKLPLKYSCYALDHSSERGCLDVLEWWLISKLPLKYSCYALDKASINGHVNILDWWFKSGLELKYSERSLDGASYNCHINVLEWWFKSGLELKYSEKALEYALKGTNINILEWWKNSKLPF